MSDRARVLVTGSRDWDDIEAIHEALFEVSREYSVDGIVLVHGACPTGADAIADKLWRALPQDTAPMLELHAADWQKYGRRAGPIRNRKMVDLGADICLAFIKNSSGGAENALRLARNAGIPCRVWRAQT